MEDQKLGPGLACSLGFAKEKKLWNFNLKFKKFPKLSQLGDMVSKLVKPKCIIDGSLGATAGQLKNFFFEKNGYFKLMPFGSHFARF